MCDDMRHEIKRLMEELGLNNTNLIDLIHREHSYPITRGEMSQFLNGNNRSPKSKRVLMDALKALVIERKKVNDLIQEAKSL